MHMDINRAREEAEPWVEAVYEDVAVAVDGHINSTANELLVSC